LGELAPVEKHASGSCCCITLLDRQPAVVETYRAAAAAAAAAAKVHWQDQQHVRLHMLLEEKRGQ
jgi:hypothetical protein